MRFPGFIVGVLLLTSTSPAAAADRIFEFGLVVCQQQEFAAPVVVLSSVQSSELVVPVAALDLPPEDSLPPDEGRPCADVLTDLTRSGYALAASTPISRRAPPPEDIFLRRKPSATERLEWTIQLTNSVALLSCDPLSDVVASFADGAAPPVLSIPEGSSCAVYLAAMLALGGEIIARNAVAPPGTPPAGPVTVYTAYELIRAFPAPDQNLPRFPRINNGRDRLP
ncbi:MAG: hypothetical protein O3A53_14885 [Acidobacteria bacterium]|nr:hypothetical protein [Acidobacteriota bacterium]MDA1236071.1 hypothetical protein [Acidobacteriota bacterium]